MWYGKGKFKFTDEEFLRAVNEGKSIKQMYELFNCNKSAIIKRLHKLNIKLHNYTWDVKFNQEVFDCIDSEEKAYWLGFIFADGYISNDGRFQFELSLKGSDYSHLEKFNLFMQHIHNNVKIGISMCNGKRFSRCRWSITNKHLWETLNKYGCTPKKSLTVKFPELSIFQDKILIRHFIRGYFDGNGSISLYTACNTTKASIAIHSGSSDLLITLNSIVGDYLHFHSVTETSHYLSACAQRSQQFLDYIYNDSSVYLDRKYEKYKNCRLAK